MPEIIVLIISTMPEILNLNVDILVCRYVRPKINVSKFSKEYDLSLLVNLYLQYSLLNTQGFINDDELFQTLDIKISHILEGIQKHFWTAN